MGANPTFQQPLGDRVLESLENHIRISKEELAEAKIKYADLRRKQVFDQTVYQQDAKCTVIEARIEALELAKQLIIHELKIS